MGCILSYQTISTHIFENQSLKWCVACGESVVDTTLAAPVAKPVFEGFHRTFVAFQHRGGDGDFGKVAVLAVHKSQVARLGRIHFLFAQDVNDIDFEIPGHQISEGCFISIFIEEIRDHNDHTRPDITSGKGFGCTCDIA